MLKSWFQSVMRKYEDDSKVCEGRILGGCQEETTSEVNQDKYLRKT